MRAKIKRLICRIFNHDWRGTVYNPFYIATEERCDRCHRYRHHTFVDAMPMDKPVRWREGRLP